MTATEKWERPMAILETWEGRMPWLMAILVGLLYALTMAPTVGHTDSGELSAVAYTFGVAHPTGYPLFTLLGWLVTRIPLGTVAMRMNVMCLVFVAASAFFWASFLREFFIQMRTSVKKGDSSYPIRIKLANLTGTMAGTLLLVFGRTWWMQSTSAEVYSLQCLLLTLMMWTLLRAWCAKENVFRHWAVFVVALALCFTNHLTAIVLLPGTLYLYFARFGLKVQSFKQGAGLAGIGIGVLALFYGMMLVVASLEPAYNWGNPEDAARLWHQMSGRQFSVYMFTGSKAFGKNFLGYLNRLPTEFGWDLIWAKIPVWIALGALVFQGMTYALQRRREWAIFFGIGFLSNVFWAANYDIKDPEPYFLFSFIVIAYLAAMVLRWSWIGFKKAAPYLTGAFLAAIVLQAVWNYGEVNQRGVWQYEDYARATIGSTEPNAIVISKAWDVLVGPGAYLQGCEQFRKDVTLLDYALLHDRHWYPTELRSRDPKLAAAIGPSLDAWEKEVYRFDVDGKVDPARLAPAFDAVWRAVLDQARVRPVYVAQDIFNAIASGEIAAPGPQFVPVPDRYLVRLRPVAEAQGYVPMAPAAPIRFGGKPDEYEHQLLKNLLAQSWGLRATYEDQQGHADAGNALRAEIKALDPQPIKPSR